MEKIHQIAIAASSSVFGVLVGIFFLYMALRNSRLNKRPRSSTVDDNNDSNFNGRRLNSQERSSLEDRRNKRINNRNKRYSGQLIEMEPLPTSLNEQTTNNQQIYHDLETCIREPTADYPVTPKLLRNVSMQENPVTLPRRDIPDIPRLNRNASMPAKHVAIPKADYPITPKFNRHVSMPTYPGVQPEADYSDDDTLDDVRVRFDLHDDSDTLEPPHSHHLKRSTSYPVMNRSGHDITGRLSGRHAARNSDRFGQDLSSHNGYQNDFPASSPPRHETNRSSDRKVANNLYYNTGAMEALRMKSDRSNHVILQIPEPDYH